MVITKKSRKIWSTVKVSRVRRYSRNGRVIVMKINCLNSNTNTLRGRSRTLEAFTIDQMIIVFFVSVTVCSPLNHIL